MLTFSIVPLVIFVGAAFFFSAFSCHLFSLLTRRRKLLYDWDREVQNSARMVAQSYTRIRQLINFFLPFRVYEALPLTWIWSRHCVLSLSFIMFPAGILGLFVASFWGDFQNFYIRNDSMPPILADNTYIQISWDTHIFSPSNIAVYF